MSSHHVISNTSNTDLINWKWKVWNIFPWKSNIRAKIFVYCKFKLFQELYTVLRDANFSKIIVDVIKLKVVQYWLIGRQRFEYVNSIHILPMILHWQIFCYHIWNLGKLKRNIGILENYFYVHDMSQLMTLIENNYT